MIEYLIAIALAVLGVLGTINVFILNGIRDQMKTMGSRLDQTKTKLDCAEDRMICAAHITKEDERSCQEMKDLWESFNRHSHTGLDSNSKVTR